MEVSIFPKHEELLKKVIEVRLHTDHKDEEKGTAFTEMQKRMTGKLALPIYVLVHPDQPETVLAKFEGADLPGGTKFANWLADAIKKAKQP